MRDDINTASLSILRFIAAIIVILFHHRKGSEILQDAPAVLTAGPQMVTFFFVLSGFVLVLAYYDKEQFSLKKYFVKRSTRIIPVYFIALFLCLAIAFVKGTTDPVATILNMLFLQAWFPPYPQSIKSLSVIKLH
jgi:peptidoglycan/LPS O-acetylase OafA/YrhL